MGSVPRYPREEQLKACVNGIERFGATPLDDAVYEPAEFDQLVSDLRMRTDSNGIHREIVFIARLDALADRGRGIGERFFMRLIRLRDVSYCIVEADTGLTSNDGEPWYDRVQEMASKLMRGRPLSKEQATKLGRVSQSDREPGLVDEWLSPIRTADRERVGQHWRDPSFKSAKEAIATAPEEFAELRTASRSTWERIFGGRTKRAKRKP